VSLLYCGKETGEFRGSAPPRNGERLREALGRAAAPQLLPEASDTWMPCPAVEAIAREARLSVAGALFGKAAPKTAVPGPFRVPAAPAGLRVAPGMPEPGFIPPDFHCENVRGAVVDRLEWQAPNTVPLPPRFGLRPVLDRFEDLAPREAAPKTKHPRGAGMGRVVEAVAASLIVAVGMWFGADSARVFRKTAAAGQRLSAAVGAAPARARARANPGLRRVASKQPLDWVRNAMSKRAAVALTDAFHTGMESWDGAGKSWAPGWSRHPDGYVRTGQLALYRPSAAYSDYRLEFFAQIESKSMGWVVRARDRQNYYAMKFTVMEPGLRPVIAVVHYPVVGGKKGNQVEVPLSVMVHNDTAYHVAVEVKGNRVVTSIEGQEVDRWTDDTLASGGVGFFSEPGERARLYWMKVAANDDFLGWICAYLSGGAEEGPERTAQWRRLESGAAAPQPRPEGAPPGRSADAVLAAAETGRYDYRNRRIQPWGFPREHSLPA